MPVTTLTLTLESDNKPIQVDRYRPIGEGPLPAVLLLHGADGLQLDHWTRVYELMAARIASGGYHVFLVRYFHATNSRFADLRTVMTHFPIWLSVINSAVAFVQRQPEVSGQCVGLVGVSLGATLAVTAGASNTNVGAVVEFFGPTPDWLPPLLGKMPPTLILHGDCDVLVGVNEARKLEKALRKHQRTCEMTIYPGQGHGFIGEAATDAMRRTNAFLDRYVKAIPVGSAS